MLLKLFVKLINAQGRWENEEQEEEKSIIEEKNRYYYQILKISGIEKNLWKQKTEPKLMEDESVWPSESYQFYRKSSQHQYPGLYEKRGRGK